MASERFCHGAGSCATTRYELPSGVVAPMPRDCLSVAFRGRAANAADKPGQRPLTHSWSKTVDAILATGR